MKLATLILFAADVIFGQCPPNADTVLLVQEREAHERAVATRIEYQVAKQSKPAAEPEPPQRKLSDQEAQQLRDALNRYFRENAGHVPIFK